MDTGLIGFYLAISIIVLLILCATLIGYGTYKRNVGTAGLGICGFIIFIVLFILCINEIHKPKAIEVYQGKTTLEYTVKDGVKVDSVVVYKEGVKKLN